MLKDKSVTWPELHFLSLKFGNLIGQEDMINMDQNESAFSKPDEFLKTELNDLIGILKIKELSYAS